MQEKELWSEYQLVGDWCDMQKFDDTLLNLFSYQMAIYFYIVWQKTCHSKEEKVVGDEF